jgi:hypothetical protein
MSSTQGRKEPSETSATTCARASGQTPLPACFIPISVPLPSALPSAARA